MTRRKPRVSTLAVIAVSGAALLIGANGCWIAIQELDDWRASFEDLPASVRADPVPRFLGLDAESWKALQHEVGEGDRYAVVASDSARVEVRHYAAYALLPAIQVTPDQDPDVVVYYGRRRQGELCLRIGREVCIVRRDAP